MALRHQVILDESGWENRFPTLINQGGGRLLLVFWRSPARPQGRHMDIAMEGQIMRSRDSGQTWSAPQLLITHDGQVSPTHPPAGEGDQPTVMMPYFHWVVLPQTEREMLETRIPRVSDRALRQDAYYAVVGAIEGAYVTRSQDGGASWSHRTRVDTQPFFWAGTRSLPTRTPGHRLLLALYGRRAEDRGDTAFVVFSDDDGRTWSEPVVTACDPEGSIEHQEPALLALSDEHILATYRIARHEPAPGTEGDEILCNESQDGGQTWTDPRATGLRGHPTDLIRLHDGAVLCVYGYRHPPCGIRAVLSQDNGATWLAQQELVLRDDAVCSQPGAPATDIGYPFVTQLDDGTLMAVYYFDAGKGQRFLAATYFQIGDFFK